MIIQIPYGASHLPIETRAVNLVGVYTPRSSAPAPDPAAAIRAALGSPVAGPRLREAARGSRSAMILVDDVTRETPAHLIVPAILEELAAGGLPADGVRVMIALGTHRPMSSAEVRRKLGADVLRDVEVLQHDHRNVALEDLGRTPDGTPISLNRDVLEAGLVIGTGSVVPHHVAGFSAGAKIVQPGVSGASTTAATHMFSARAGTPLLGQVDSTVRREMESIAERAGMHQVLNVTLNSDGRLVSAHFGATKAAFRRAVDDARRIYGVPAAGELDIVIAGSHPCDIEFWQAHKSLYPAVMMTRRNGTIILVNALPRRRCRDAPGLAWLRRAAGRRYRGARRTRRDSGPGGRGAGRLHGHACASMRASCWCPTGYPLRTRGRLASKRPTTWNQRCAARPSAMARRQAWES